VSSQPIHAVSKPWLTHRSAFPSCSEMTKTTFGTLPRGARFLFLGKSYVKTAMSMAEDENRHGNIFQTETEVERIDPAESSQPGPAEANPT